MREKDRLKLLKGDSQTALLEGVDKEKETGKSRKSKTALKIKRRTKFAKRLLQAGYDVTPKTYVSIAFAISTTAAYFAYLLGPLLAIFIFIALLHFLCFGYLDERANRRQKKVVPQLAPFIDGLASALATGFNIDAAVVQATQGVPRGILRSELDRVSAALTAGFSVKESLVILRERISGREITALVVCLGLFATMGGTVLEPFRRLANKIREQQAVVEKANRDLVMVRQAFYMIFFLALSVPLVLSLVQPDYLANALKSSFGRTLLQVGEIAILAALVAFKKVTNLRI